MTTNFLGIPVDGDISRGEKRTPQKPLTELEPLIRALLDDPGMVDFGWRQYTPYFNDGDPCVFSVGEPWFRTTADVKAVTDAIAGDARAQQAEHAAALSRLNGGDDDEDWDDPDSTYQYELGGHPSLGDRPHTYNRETREYDAGQYEGPDEARYDRCRAFAEAIGSGAFDDVLLEAFGDHCSVIIRKDRISVSEYSRD